MQDNPTTDMTVADEAAGHDTSFQEGTLADESAGVDSATQPGRAFLCESSTRECMTGCHDRHGNDGQRQSRIDRTRGSGGDPGGSGGSKDPALS